MPRFVILEHRWRGTHWDLMLEVEPGGPLRTWALDQAPIVAEPHEAIPARALPDHRAAYLTYEGPISGDRGEVRRVDAGTFAVIEWADACVVVELAGETTRGRLVLTTSGETDANEWLVQLIG
jgi:hypothetical protein